MSNAEKNIYITSQTEYQKYSCVAGHDIWATVSLEAPLFKKKRVPVDIVAVLDKSLSMEGEKIRLVKKTMKFLFKLLNERDRLALISYESKIDLDFAFMKMTNENKKSAIAKIMGMGRGTTADLSGALIRGLAQIIDRPDGDRNKAAYVLLLSDGLASSGRTTAEEIVAAMKDPKHFDMVGTKQSFEKQRTINMVGNKFVVVKAPPEQNYDVPSDRPANATVYAFGFGADHNSELLEKITDAGHGMYYFVENEDKIREAFNHCLNGLTCTVAQGIKMQVTLQPGVTIKDVYSARPCEQVGDQSVEIDMGDLLSEESRDIAMQLTIQPVIECTEDILQTLFDVKVDFHNVITSNVECAIDSLGVLRTVRESSYDGYNVSPILIKEKCRIDMIQAMEEAHQKCDLEDFLGAQDLLSSQVDDMKKKKEQLVKYGISDQTEEELEDMIVDMEELKGKTSFYLCWQALGKKISMNKMQRNRDYQLRSKR